MSSAFKGFNRHLGQFSHASKEGDALGLIDLKKTYAWGVGTYRSSSTGKINIA